jgi:UDP-glucose:(heptosyl)LPS alpha-1,3-glucosyltransferase
MAMKGTHGGYLAARRSSAGPLWRLYSHLRPRHLLSARLERRLLRDPGLLSVRVMSRRGAAEVADHCGLPPERCAVIPHGVEAGRFELSRRPSCRAEVRGRHGLREGDLVAVSVGSNFTLKGLAHLLRALARCAARGGPRMRLLVVGRGREAPFRRLAERLGVAGQVVFVGASDRVADYLLAADLFVLPSIYETFGLSVLEAMAAGLPVVVSAACGASELVEEGASGFVLEEPADSDTFAARLLALSDAELRGRLGARARQTAELWPPERDYEATRALLEKAARLRRHL